MILKLDMSKAYGLVKLGILESVLQKMDFEEKVDHLFMTCIFSVNYQINHAGKESGHINPISVLRQGDPLSSYLFLICNAGFTALIYEYEKRGWIQGIKVARNAPSISHMFFVNDCYIFCKASMKSANHVLNMLHVFEEVSTQQINVKKSSIFFSYNTSSQLKQDLFQQLRIKEGNNNTFYMGLSNMVTRKKSTVFGFIKKKSQECLQG